MESKIKRTIAILLVVCFLVSLTATAVSAVLINNNINGNPKVNANWVSGNAGSGGVAGVSPEYQIYNMYMHDGHGDGLRTKYGDNI